MEDPENRDPDAFDVWIKLEAYEAAVTEPQADKARVDFLFSEQTDVIIVDHGVVGPEPGLIITREDLDRVIQRDKK